MKDTAAELVLLPGTYDIATHAVVGPLTVEMIRQVGATKIFLGADSLSLSAGLITTNLEIAVVERSMVSHTRGKSSLLRTILNSAGDSNGIQRDGSGNSSILTHRPDEAELTIED